MQLKAIKELSAQGWLVGKTERVGKFIKVKDLFGLADLVAIKPQVVKFVQVTCNRPHTLKPYTEFGALFCGEGLQLEQWVWFDRKGWKIYRFSGGQYTVNRKF